MKNYLVYKKVRNQHAIDIHGSIRVYGRPDENEFRLALDLAKAASGKRSRLLIPQENAEEELKFCETMQVVFWRSLIVNQN